MIALLKQKNSENFKDLIFFSKFTEIKKIKKKNKKFLKIKK